MAPALRLAKQPLREHNRATVVSADTTDCEDRSGGFVLSRTYGGAYTKGSDEPKPSNDFREETIIKNALVEMQTC